MTGVEMMLKTVLSSLGVRIDAVEIETAWNRSKDALPELARVFAAMEKRLASIESKLERLEHDNRDNDNNTSRVA